VVLIVSGGMVINVNSGHRVNPYLDIPMPSSMKGWRKKWFCLRNDASPPLPVFTGGRPISLPSKGDGVARKISTSCSPCVRPFRSVQFSAGNGCTAGGVDWGAPSTYNFQPTDSTAPAAED
jgi:hypothetical protein